MEVLQVTEEGDESEAESVPLDAEAGDTTEGGSDTDAGLEATRSSSDDSSSEEGSGGDEEGNDYEETESDEDA